MPKRTAAVILSLLLSVTATPAAWGQALVPYTLEFDQTQLEQEGLAVAQDAVQLIRFQQLEEALSRAKLATQLAPGAYEAWALLGGLYLSLNQTDPGVVALERSLTLNRKNPGIFFSLGAGYFRQGKYAKAAQTIEAGLALKPNVADELFNLGNAYLKLQQNTKAIAQYRKALAIDKKFWPAANNIGLIQYESGDIRAAITSWRAAVAIDSKASEPLLALAVALYTQGNRDQGLAMAEAALKLDPRYAEVKFLKENLWGDRLIADTKPLLATPRIRATLAKLQAETTSTPQQ